MNSITQRTILLTIVLTTVILFITRLPLEKRIDVEQLVRTEKNVKEYPQEKYKVCLVSIPGTREIQFPKHPKMTFIQIKPNMKNPHNRFATIGTHDVLFDYTIREETKDTYPFEQYREDIALSSSLYLFTSEKEFKNCDYVYVPPMGIKPTEVTVNKFYSFINQIHHEYPSACFYQTDVDDKFRNTVLKGNNTFIPHFPSVSFRQLGGILLTPRRFYLLYEYGKLMYHISRFDENLQVYCDIDYNKVVVANENIFGIKKENCFDCF